MLLTILYNEQLKSLYKKLIFCIFKVSAIENTQDHKSELNISGIGFLTKFVEKGRSEIVLDYDAASGLLTSRSDFSVAVSYLFIDVKLWFFLFFLDFISLIVTCLINIRKSK